MSKRPALYVVASRGAKGKVVPLRAVPRAAPRKPAVVLELPRETSWRDLVRRLAKNPQKA